MDLVVEPFPALPRSARQALSQGARRREHLTCVAAHLIVTCGVDAVNHASVAEHAGVARTLVYRYFPRREDLLYAVFTAEEQETDRRIRPPEVTAGIVACKDATDGAIPESTQKVLERLWQPEDWDEDQSVLERRLAAIILSRDADLDRLIGDHAAHRQRQLFEERLRGPLRGAGLSPVEVELLVDALLSVQYHVTKAVMAREITRDEVVRLFFNVISGMIQSFTR